MLLRLDRWCAPALITAIKQHSKLYHPSLEAGYALALNSNPQLWDNNTTKEFCAFGALAGFRNCFLFFSCWRGRLPVFCCVLLLITSNNSVLALCQTPRATLAPCCLSHHPVSSLVSFTLLSPDFCSVARNLTGGLAAHYRSPRRNDGWEIACAGEWSGSQCGIKEAMDCYRFLSDTIISFGLKSPSWCIASQSAAGIF